MPPAASACAFYTCDSGQALIPLSNRRNVKMDTRYVSRKVIILGSPISMQNTGRNVSRFTQQQIGEGMDGGGGGTCMFVGRMFVCVWVGCLYVCG